ncbi:MAG: DMT family transporter [Bacillota bacterium]|nr:DMT family transporter [Bacillota bacterium]
MTNKKGHLGRLALVTTTLIWGTSFVILKNTLDSITPAWVMAYRFMGAAVVLLLAAIPRLKMLDKSYLKGGFLMGLCLAAGYLVQTYGLDNTTPGKNAFLTATYCILVPFLNWILMKRKPDGFNIFAACLCMVGVGFVCLSGTTGLTDINIGDILTLCCGLFYGLHIIATDKFVDGRDAILLSFVQFAVAAAICLALAVIFEPMPQHMPAEAWYSIAYLSLMCTGACFLLQTWGQKYTPPSTAAIILMLESVFGAIISVIAGQEILTVGIVLGFMLIFIAILISETKLEFIFKRKRNI